jgi:hypothetical protein
MVLVVPVLGTVNTDNSSQAFLATMDLLTTLPPTVVGGSGIGNQPLNQRQISAQIVAFNQFYVDGKATPREDPLKLSVRLPGNQTWLPSLCRAYPPDVTVTMSRDQRECEWTWTHNYIWGLRTSDMVDKQLGGVYVLYSRRITNNESAQMNMTLTVLVVLVLLVFSIIFSMGMATLVVKPLERVMTIIYENTSHLSGSLLPSELNQELLNETDALERAIAKMTRILNYVGDRLNNTGGGMLQEALKNRNLDENTQAYLQQYTTAGGGDTKKVDVEKEKAASTSAAAPASGSETVVAGRPVGTNESDIDPVLVSFGLNKLKDPGAIDHWEFNVFDYSDEQLVTHTAMMFHRLDLITRNMVTPSAFSAFMQKISSGYHASNPYHNFRHAVDVAHTMYRMLTASQASPPQKPVRPVIQLNPQKRRRLLRIHWFWYEIYRSSPKLVRFNRCASTSGGSRRLRS